MFHPSERLTRAVTLAVVGGLSLGATGIAVAAIGAGSEVPHQSVPSPTPITPFPGQTQAGQDQGTGDHTPAGEKTEKPDAGEAKTETPDTGEAKNKTEREPANDAEANHQDANGANVDHTPAGEQPEVSGSAQG